jgi:hypothetical protein
VREVPPDRLAQGVPADPLRPARRGSVVGHGCGVPERVAPGVYALGRMGAELRRTVADPDRPRDNGCGSSVVRLAHVDRTGLSGNQAGRLGVAQDADAGAGSCGAVVGRDRGGDALGGRGRWRGGTGERAGDPRPAEPVEARVVADLVGASEPRIHPTGTIQHHDWPKTTTTTTDVLLGPYVHEG